MRVSKSFPLCNIFFVRLEPVGHAPHFQNLVTDQSVAGEYLFLFSMAVGFHERQKPIKVSKLHNPDVPCTIRERKGLSVADSRDGLKLPVVVDFVS